MNEGQIEQVGSPDEVYHHPASPFVYNFLGNVNCSMAASTRKDFPSIKRQPPGIWCTYAPICWRSTARPKAAISGPLSSTFTPPDHWVKIEALAEWGAPVQVELSQERFRDLQLTKNEAVFIIPKEMKVFQKKDALAAR